MGAYKRIIVGSDGSATSLLAVDRAGAIAAEANAELLVVSAYEPADKAEVAAASDALKADAFQVVGSAPAENALREAADRARAAGATKVETLAVQGAPIKVLDDAVTDCDADLLVVGNVGLNTLTGRILGSVPSGVARRAGVDVLIVHTS
ncbi:universal stress protein [Pseudonocardia spinosispora]|uniref:universal stress protein n=1 Tax=Pseudonocardia spinosispora TaxID=103441 RepID=UPI0004014980|nr:universal stress protein [Pseudonocardia spinosispora]